MNHMEMGGKQSKPKSEHGTSKISFMRDIVPPKRPGTMAPLNVRPRTPAKDKAKDAFKVAKR